MKSVREFTSAYSGKIVIVSLGLLFVIAPTLHGVVGQGVFPAIYMAIVVCTIMIMQLKNHIQITKTDICVIAYLFYSIINILFIRSTTIDPLFIYQWILLMLIYLSVRAFKDAHMLLYCLVISGVLQSMIGILQWIGIIASNHQTFPITGSFANPGPYGGFLALAFLAAIWLVLKIKHFKAALIRIITATALIGVMLIASDSRAAWLAVIVGIAIILLGGQKAKVKFIACGVGVILLAALYMYRPSSADARLLIWRVCTDITADKPLFGHGIASLPANYMNYQSQYFENNPDSKLAGVANNNYQAFNEFIHITCEQGVVGLVLFLILLYSCRKSKYVFLLGSLLVFSCFSYPSDVLSLKVLFPLFIGLTAYKQNKFTLHIRKWCFFVVLLIMLPFAICTHLKYNLAFNNITATTSAQLPNNLEYMLAFSKQHQTIGNFKYVTNYVCSSSDMLCDMGDIYRQQGDILSSDSCYLKALNMIPYRILPIYKLFLLYENSDSTKAHFYAEKILNHSPKIVNSVVLRARAAAKSHLNPDYYE